MFNPLAAQEESVDYKEWINFGIAEARSDNDRHLNLSISYNWGRSTRFYQAKYDYIGGLRLGAGTRLHALNFGLGLRSFGRYHLLKCNVGPVAGYGTVISNVTDSNQRTFEKEDNFGLLGLHSQIQAFVKPFPEIGIGIQLFYSRNLVREEAAEFRKIYGLMLALHVSNGK